MCCLDNAGASVKAESDLRYSPAHPVSLARETATPPATRRAVAAKTPPAILASSASLLSCHRPWFPAVIPPKYFCRVFAPVANEPTSCRANTGPGGTPQEISRGPARHERSPRNARRPCRAPAGHREKNRVTAPRAIPPAPLRGVGLPRHHRGLRSCLAGPRLIFCEAPPGPLRRGGDTAALRTAGHFHPNSAAGEHARSGRCETRLASPWVEAGGLQDFETSLFRASHGFPRGRGKLRPGRALSPFPFRSSG